MIIEIEVEEYDSKYYPLRQSVGEGSYRGKEITYATTIPTGALFITIDGEPFIVHPKDIITKIIDLEMDSQMEKSQ